MDRQQLRFSFEDCLPADAAILAQDLEQQFREAAPSATVKLEKVREDSQDFGTTVVLVFGTPVAIALARGTATFLQRHSGASISITTPSGEIVARNLDSRDAARIAEAFGVKRSR